MSQGARSTPAQIALVVVSFAGVLNLAFMFLSKAYFEERARRYGIQELAFLGEARQAFAVFTSLIGATTILAFWKPRWMGHGIPTVAGLAALVAAWASWSAGLQPTLWVTLAIVGAMLPVVTWLSFQKSRAAWSFLLALCAVLALILLFGAPKVRGLVGVGLWHALILPGVLAIGAIALSMVHTDYQES